MNKLSPALAGVLAAGLALSPCDARAIEVLGGEEGRPLDAALINKTQSLVGNVQYGACVELSNEISRKVFHDSLIAGVGAPDDAIDARVTALKKCLESHIRYACGEIEQEIRDIVLQIATQTGSDFVEADEEADKFSHDAKEVCLGENGVRSEMKTPKKDRFAILGGIIWQ